ncbi:sulfate adenylyltransferase subunit 2 [Salinibacter ruber]|nr:sulfate adenylyltransferase subunit CysD [Salinibacter ruber]MCS3668754.1 sulfate adenylyltransferase subunit 2 [Salinibacter ruber]MCS3749268.1 sulfate adenylyltransferase subunit 2 [Salinibacter ruber]MCS3955418.1 sulfate adenylyltransferase subunit 2 [Salinibacter ruber]MCS4049196.1 sulfate adenylyltransferase subunit 2 [Salinibacter ruber]MCS4177411.1 sulfate adenylyltransferase subunit 2 [Salinibacter ruber]
MPMSDSTSEHLDWLESEAIHVMRETVAQFDNPVLMFSGGKDSLTMIHLARKAFYPAKVPFPILHVDTGHNFPETIEFRDTLMEKHGLDLIVGSVEETIESGRAKEEQGPDASRNKLQIVTLLDTIEEYGFDAALGGARRDEEKARAKERFFSHRDRFGNWDPKNQRPELWNLYNGRSRQGEHFRAFPLSNWTELDVWQYIRQEGVEIPSLYLAHERTMFERDGVLLPKSPYNDLREDEHYVEKMVRFRTIGDMTCTGAVESTATTLDEVIAEVATTQQAERGARADDQRAEAAMEERKREGYF